MIVGTDERRNAWMDEGFNTFIDVYEADTSITANTRPSAIRNTRPATATRPMKSSRC
jgi:hypothetical protein